VRRILPVLVAALLLSGCAAAVEEPEIPSPFAACDGLTGGTASEIPDISLPCFTGGAEVRLRDLRGPAVINIWGSWCGPCREELPLLQGLADRADGRFAVIGVDARDTRNRGADFATDRSVTFPTLFDQEMRFAGELGVTMLPATVFIKADGGIYVHRNSMDVDQLIEQVRKQLGITVTR
jgi:cytochrome c biogenesis protein CcmG/thiol:disulfide interchange protein DsbE